jgi:hypothetical protein
MPVDVLKTVFEKAQSSYLSITTSYLSIVTSNLSVTRGHETVTLRSDVVMLRIYVITLKRSTLMLKISFRSSQTEFVCFEEFEKDLQVVRGPSDRGRVGLRPSDLEPSMKPSSGRGG